jgi:hypothetical protein
MKDFHRSVATAAGLSDVLRTLAGSLCLRLPTQLFGPLPLCPSLALIYISGRHHRLRLGKTYGNRKPSCAGFTLAPLSSFSSPWD